MSTKPGIPSSVPKHAGTRRRLSASLCTSALAQKTSEIISFRAMPDSPATISVRALSLPADIPVIYNWVSRDHTTPRSWSTRDTLRELEEAYASILESDFAQPFMGLVNGAPVCQLDIYKTRQDAISLYYDDRPGDYGLHWLMAPLCQQDHMVALLRACLEYFFSFPEVGRIVTDIESGNEWMDLLFRKAGFRSGGELNIPYKKSHLYICTRKDLTAITAAE